MKSRNGMSETVFPIKRKRDRLAFKRYWKKHTNKQYMRNSMIFDFGTHTGLRASDLVRLNINQVYDKNGNPRTYLINQKDKKTRKQNNSVYLHPLRNKLIKYRKWLYEQLDNPVWLFPKATDKRSHITSHYLYQIIKRAANGIGFETPYGSHSLRKTFGYLVYKRTKGDIGTVMHLLNQSSETVTKRYIGISRTSTARTLDKVFDE